MRMIIACLLLVLVGCGKEKKKPKSGEDSRRDQIVSLFNKNLDLAEEIRDPDTGWLTRDCDAMIWTGKYAAVLPSGRGAVDILAAEFPGSPGRFGRRPTPNCWNPIDGDVGSKTTWSRDMFIAGLLPWAWKKKEVAPLQRHEEYGRANTWKMGEPLDDGRTLYTPSLVGILYQAIFELGGSDNTNRHWPSIYSSGLDDFQAHLQVMDIWFRGEAAEASEKPQKPEEGANLTTLEVSETMYMRLVEHADREPKCWTYQAMRGIYDGMEHAIDIVLAGDNECSYVRCGGEEACHIAERLWALDIILERVD